MPATTGKIIVTPPAGLSVVVAITNEAGTTITTYTAENGSTTHDSPDTISTATTYHLPQDGLYVLSVKYDGQEIAGRGGTTISSYVGGSQVWSVAPSIDSFELDAVNNAFATANTAGDVAEPIIERLVVPATSFVVVQGSDASFVLGNQFGYPLWTIPSGATYYVGTIAELPSHWSTWSLTLHHMARSATTDDVDWQVICDTVGVGEALASAALAGSATQAFDGTAHKVTATTLFTGRAAPAANETVQLKIGRAGAADTYTGTVGLLRVVLTKDS